MAHTVVNEARKDVPRLIVSNTGSIRSDLPQGPFTRDDGFAVSPYKNTFQFLPDVPYATSQKVIAGLEAATETKKTKHDKRSAEGTGAKLARMLAAPQSPKIPWRRRGEPCEFPEVPESVLALLPADLLAALPADVRAILQAQARARQPTAMPLVKRTTGVTPGYTTTDDFGDDGDDTVHSPIPRFDQPKHFHANASFPTDGSAPKTVDLVFVDFIAPKVLDVMDFLGENYKAQDVQTYMPADFTTNSFLEAYAKDMWHAGLPNCPIGLGIGS
jgi:hypothetical protein